jgi:hypothetical protein
MLLGMTALTVGARAADLQQSAYRGGVAQEDARRSAEKIQRELGDLVAEMQLNGFGAADLELLVKTSDNLANLGNEDMRKVIAALQNAGAAGEADGQRENLLTAYQGQKDIALKLQKLAVEFTTRQVVGTIQSRLQNLTLRQAANLRNTRAIDHDAKAGAAGAVVGSEQSAIAAETGLLARNIQSALNQVAPDAPVGVARVVLEALTAGTLREDADVARQLTVSGQYRASLAKQSAVYQELVRVLRAALAAQGATEALAELLRQLERLIAGERALMVAGGEADRQDLARQQTRLQDGAALAEGLLKTLNAAAAAHVTRAETAMRQSAEALSQARAARPSQEAAVTALEAARKLLEPQIAAVQKQQQDAIDKQIADMKSLLDEVRKTQAEVQRKAEARQADQANQLAQQALANTPAAAENLFNAASQLQQDAEANQQSAAAELGKAADQLQLQINAAQQIAADYQKLEQAAQQLSQAQQQTQQAQQSLQQQGSVADAARQLMGARQQLSQIGQQGLPEQAKQAIQGAGQSLKDAVAQAAQSKAEQAGQQTRQAGQALQQARDALAQSMQQMKQQAGLTPSAGYSQTQGESQDHQQAVMGAQGSDGTAGSKSFVGSGGIDGAKNFAQVVGNLKPRDREAIAQSAAQKIPQEYTQAVQQYLKNLTTVTDPSVAR